MIVGNLDIVSTEVVIVLMVSKARIVSFSHAQMTAQIKENAI